MAQEPGLFSVRRQTLAPVNNNMTSIPMPSSAMKRSSSVHGMQQAAVPFTANHARSQSGSRMSLAPGRPSQPIFQRSSSGTNLAEQGLQSAHRNSTSNMFSASSTGARKSFAPRASLFQATPAPAPNFQQESQRRSSVFKSRNSQIPGQSGVKQSFFQTAPQPAGVPNDPRRLKDASTRQQLANELLDYLTQNNFEMESKHVLSPKCMSSPTQKDFVSMFQWLYHRIDPSYRFQKSIDQEVPVLLKQLRYPYEKSIMKSQLAAVGGNNWPTFLGLLHWIMQLSKMINAYEQGSYDDACFAAGHDVSGDRIIFDFLSDAYATWLSADDVDEGEDEEEAQRKIIEPHIQSMARKFDEANAQHIEEVKLLEAEHKTLQDQIDKLSEAGPRIQELTGQIKTLEDDRTKFEAYNNSLGQRVQKYTDRSTLLQQEMDKIEAELAASEQERQELQAVIDGRGMNITDIDRMSSEKERLDVSLQTASARVEESKKRVVEKELAASRKLDELEHTIERFNNIGYQIGVIPSTAANAKGLEYELVLTINDGPNFSGSQMGSSAREASDRLLADSGTGYSPHHLLNLDLRGTVKSNILGLRKEIAERRNAALEADMSNHDMLDKVKEAIDDKQAEVEALGHRVAQAEEELEKLREITNTQKIASDAQIEKMEKELGRMRSGLGESVQLMVQKEMAVNIEYEQLQLRANTLREELHTEIERMLDDIVRFKLHIQKSLEEYEEFVSDEVERSCEEEDQLRDVDDADVA
ncbi:kinetochore-associated Ndc80 complex subunit ndc80 [Didymosphaeria variabile]|uniref:Kinetochore protein NDC80 n=1 Tax=Didymosphaeria variabile TaxID=1932322 RepID=A0A9W8XHR8_9PLEO|nr:kinetochore-associated Ndc80 complex subunit ndc80 [Didymosphaeria variabile]KAJ4349922.1 kinetochore-associated Ndc80 complex subunit ndc80 [Didymosphaeria variabile]